MLFKPTPWDEAVFHMPTYEVICVTEEALKQSTKQKGHYTVKVPPLTSKEMLFRYGYYYTDTLLTPSCKRERFVEHHHKNVSISYDVSYEALKEICHGAFRFGRFHRDFNLDPNDADKRYDLWLKQLYDQKQAFAFVFDGEIVGFFGYNEHHILLHALGERVRGKGLAKYFWSAACKHLFEKGYDTLESSVSAGNLPVVNLYHSLGFSYSDAVDVYHRLTE